MRYSHERESNGRQVAFGEAGCLNDKQDPKALSDVAVRYDNRNECRVRREAL
ncbi:hypothetical protein AOE01nite_03880 [Acetobacter oeni]|uniref:Uncharacterized protein n=1 Tax=Acetobacter oeni TaxID=304077 RepID=A0A511XGT8_9PROT|nr:hypothetical protein AA21952_1914 [Acetobacter oeni LMG 21952]GEN62164.1 hypothetical protein AOE01nite_03880 [Acetobacter oeni]